MSNVFSAPRAPAPDPELKAAQERQQQRLDAQEQQKMSAIAARKQARMVGGKRMLLSSDRPDAELGISKTTLGS
jgi:hypothetical protein